MHGALFNASERIFEFLRHTYERSLGWALRHSRLMLALTLLTVVVNIVLFVIIPKGFFPEQDIGRITGQIQAAQDISFQAMRQKLHEVVEVIRTDPDVTDVLGFSGGTGGGGSTTNAARMFISLKPFEKRRSTARQVIARLRPKLAQVPGAPTFLQPVQDLRIGGMASAALYQFTLRGENLDELNTWGPRVLEKLRTLPQLRDVNSDQQDRGLQASLEIDRDSASRLGLTAQLIDDTLYDAFGQRQVSIIYTPSQSVSCGDGGGPAILAASCHPAADLCAFPQGLRSSLECLHSLPADQYASIRQPFGAIPVGDHLL